MKLAILTLASALATTPALADGEVQRLITAEVLPFPELPQTNTTQRLSMAPTQSFQTPPRSIVSRLSEMICFADIALAIR